MVKYYRSGYYCIVHITIQMMWDTNDDVGYDLHAGMCLAHAMPNDLWQEEFKSYK